MPPGWGGCGSDTTGLMHGKVLLIPMCVNVAENLVLSLCFGEGAGRKLGMHNCVIICCTTCFCKVRIVSHLGFTDLTR